MIFGNRMVAAGMLLCAMNATGLERADYDRDGDGLIAPIEYARYVLDLHSPPLSRFDENLDGRIEGQEQERATEALLELEGKVSPCVDDFLVDYPDGQEVEDFVALDATCQLRDDDFFKGEFPERLMVRASTDDLILFRPKSADVRRGALFSFARDLSSSANIASVKGAIIRPINLASPESAESRVHYLLPSLTVNLLSDDREKNQNENVDTLSFRLAYETGFSTEYLDWVRLGLSPVLITDSSFDLDIRGADFQFEPTVLGGGMGASRRFGDFRLRWRGYLQSEYGKVASPGERSALAKDDYAFRAGGKLAMRLWPDQVFPSGIGKRLIFDAQYLQMWEMSGDLGDRDYLQVSLSYLLDRAGHFRLQTEYVKGDATQALEDEESWRIGLGVLY